MEDAPLLQLILPTDKRNPCFSLHLDEDQKSIHVYYGLELLEVVPNDPEHCAYKLLAGRLYNAGLKVRVLEEVFQADRKTIRLWGQALLSRDPEQLQRALLGREVSRKCTAAIKAYVRRRWPQLQAEGCRNHRQKLGQEIEEIFGTKLSGESLRLLFSQIDDLPPEAAEGDPPSSSATAAAPSPATPSELAAGLPVEGPPTAATNRAAEPSGVEAPPASATELLAEVVPAPTIGEKGCSVGDPGCSAVLATSKSSPPIWSPEPGGTYWCDHAGLLWFAAGLGGISGALNPPEPLLAQWLASVLLGAINIEQTKYLNWDDLSLLLASVVRFPTPQREQLKRLSTVATVDAVLRWNLAQLDSPPGSDLYLDPHTKHYTGMQAVLKGWCAAIRWADKAVHSDFVHTAQGHPIYFECTDNFEDLRARFGPLLQRMRTSLGWTAERVLTMVVDRGIFSAELFEDVIKDPALHLITWQKGYEAEAWDPAQTSGSFGLERSRNHAGDVRLYRFEYVDRPWDKNPLLRQLIVRATNPEGRTVQVAVLTDDLQRPASEIIRLIFSRWLQENDFKYLDKHFGINQLTSYRSIPYEELKNQLTDRQVQSQACRELIQTGQDIQRQQARVLLVQERAQRAENLRQEKIKKLAEQREQPGTEGTEENSPQISTAELARLKTASQRYEIYRQHRQARLDALHEELKQNQAKKEAAQQEVSRVDQLIQQDIVRLDTSSKRVMDAIKITARNLFYQSLAPFKKAYNNYRDDHDYFRQLTLTAGVLRWTGQEIEVHLVPHLNYSPQLRKIIQDLMNSLNQRPLKLPDGSQRPLRFYLTRKEQIALQIRSDPASGAQEMTAL
jgi:hypothetical protein